MNPCLLHIILNLWLAFSLSSVVYWMAIPVFNTRPVDHVGVFSGAGELESALAALGYYALPFDQVLVLFFICAVCFDMFVRVCVTQVLDPGAMNILTPAGYWLARDYVNRVRPEGCVWFGTPCASWAWISSSECVH